MRSLFIVGVCFLVSACSRAPVASHPEVHPPEPVRVSPSRFDIPSLIEKAFADQEIKFDFAGLDRALEAEMKKAGLESAEQKKLFAATHERLSKDLKAKLIEELFDRYYVQAPDFEMGDTVPLSSFQRSDEIIYYFIERFNFDVAETPLLIGKWKSGKANQAEYFPEFYFEEWPRPSIHLRVKTAQGDKALEAREPIVIEGIHTLIAHINQHLSGASSFVLVNEAAYREGGNALLKTLVHELRHYYDSVSRPHIFKPGYVESSNRYAWVPLFEFRLLNSRFEGLLKQGSSRAFVEFQLRERQKTSPNTPVGALRTEIEKQLKDTYVQSLLLGLNTLYGEKERRGYHEEIVFANERLHEDVETIARDLDRHGLLFRVWDQELPAGSPQPPVHPSSWIYVRTLLQEDKQ